MVSIKKIYSTRCCTLYSGRPDVPPLLARCRKHDFGLLSKLTASGVKRSATELKFGMKRHTNLDLHLWCLRKAEKEEHAERKHDDINKEVGLNVIRGALKNLQRGLGASDFLADMDFLNSTKNVPNSQKNNSQDAFFEIRDDCFEIVSEDIKTFFNSGKVTEISCTLDKVTVNHVSYMVLLTFFFYQGRIFCLLNKLATLDVESYDSPGTANLVVTHLGETLGLSVQRLSEVLVHFSYDGVFASSEERVDGGGSLELVLFVERELQLERGSLTGTWDFAHQLQIIWKKSLGENQVVEEVIALMFSTMGDYRLGKYSTIFHERAKELGHLVLTNKKDQTTRFVASLARGMKTFFQNLPTLIAVKADLYNTLVGENKSTEARGVLFTLSKLRDPRNLLLQVGLAVLLEVYCDVSVTSQHSTHFPTQAWAAVSEGLEKLKKLSLKWEWGAESLRNCDIEAPENVLKRLLQKGTYEPMMSEKNAAKKKQELRDMGVLQDGQTSHDIYEDGHLIKPLSGSVAMEVPLAWRPRRGGLFKSGEEDGRSGSCRNLEQDDIEASIIYFVQFALSIYSKIFT